MIGAGGGAGGGSFWRCNVEVLFAQLDAFFRGGAFDFKPGCIAGAHDLRVSVLSERRGNTCVVRSTRSGMNEANDSPPPDHAVLHPGPTGGIYRSLGADDNLSDLGSSQRRPTTSLSASL